MCDSVLACRSFRFLQPWVLVAGVATALLTLAFAAKSQSFLEPWSTNQVSDIAQVDCLIYANGRYVAFGQYSDWGVILSSDDGRTWTGRSDGRGEPSPSGLSYAVGLCYTGTRFFALGGFGTSAVSADGVNWTVFSLPDWVTPLGVAYGNGKYVAATEATWDGNRNIAISSDGTTWIAVSSSSPAGVWMRDITFGAGRFVALPFEGDPGRAYVSSNGLNWSRPTIPLPGSRISHVNNLFIISAGPGTNLLSTNGLNWAIVSTGLSGALGKVQFANGIFLAKAGSALAASQDGTNWVQYLPTIPGNSYVEPNFATDGNRLLSVGGTWTPIYYKGFVYTCDRLCNLEMAGGNPPTLRATGLVGRSNRIEFADVLSSGAGSPWRTLTNFRLTTNPIVIEDHTATSIPARFYRSYLLD